MKNLLALAFAVLMVGCALMTVDRPAAGPRDAVCQDHYSREAFQRDVADATVVFESGLEDHGYLGSGVIIAQDAEKATILTAAHVIEDEDLTVAYVEQIRPGHPIIRGEPGMVIKKYDRLLDIAVVETKNVNFAGTAKMYKADTINRLRVYVRCYNLGFPRIGLQEHVPSPHMTTGFISQLDGQLMFSAQVYYGSSGSGLFVQDGDSFYLVSVVQRLRQKDSSHMYDWIASGADPYILLDFVD